MPELATGEVLARHCSTLARHSGQCVIASPRFSTFALKTKLAENIYPELGMGTEVCANGYGPGTQELISFIRYSVLCSTTCAMIFRPTYFITNAGMEVRFL